MKLTTITEITDLHVHAIDSQLDYIAYTIANKLGEHLAEETVMRMKEQIEKQLDSKFTINIVIQKRGWLAKILGL